MKRIITLLSVFVLICSFTFSSAAKSSRINDDANLLDSNEEAMLEDLLSDIYNEYYFDAVVVTVDGTDGKSITSYADDYYDNNGYCSDGLLLLIDMDSREWWISTSGMAIEYFSDSILDYIGEEVVYYLSDGRYYEAFYTFAELSYTYIYYGVNDLTDEYDDTFGYESDLEVGIGTKIVVSLIVGFIIALVYTSGLKSQLTTVGAQRSAVNYAVSNSLNIATTGDSFLYKNISRTPRPKSNSSRSGSSTHRSSSGRSHGGRGGRF